MLVPPPTLIIPYKMIQDHSLVAQMVKKLHAFWGTRVQLLGWEDPLEEGMTTHSSILAWRIPMEREAWRTTVHGVSKSQI